MARGPDPWGRSDKPTDEAFNTFGWPLRRRSTMAAKPLNFAAWRCYAKGVTLTRCRS